MSAVARRRCRRRCRRRRRRHSRSADKKALAKGMKSSPAECRASGSLLSPPRPPSRQQQHPVVGGERGGTRTRKAGNDTVAAPVPLACQLSRPSGSKRPVSYSAFRRADILDLPAAAGADVGPIAIRHQSARYRHELRFFHRGNIFFPNRTLGQLITTRVLATAVAGQAITRLVVFSSVDFRQAQLCVCSSTLA